MLLVKWCIAIVVAAAAGLGVYFYAPDVKALLAGGTSPADSPLRRSIETATVQRKDLRVVFVETGKLRAVKSHPILPQISRRELKITWLADEGASVRAGDRLVTFDTREFEDNLRKLTADLERSRQDLIVKQAALDIAISNGLSAIKTAETALKQADVEFKTYRDMAGPKRLNELDTQINDARGKLADAQKDIQAIRQQLDDQLFSDDEQKKQLEERLADSRERFNTLKRIVDSSQQQKKIFRQYEYPQQYDAKFQAVEKAELERTKARVTAEQEETQKRAELQQVKDNIAQLERQIEETESNIAKCTLVAPIDGLVVYGDPSRPIYYSGQSLAVGGSWYGGNVMMTIPDMSAFEIDLQIPEEYRGRVTEGVPVRVSLEAVPGLVIDGKLKSISQLGRQNPYYFDPDGARSFSAVVSLDGHDPRMVSGMTAKVEIVADFVEATLVVPVEALFNDQGNPVAWVLEGPRRQKRPVTPGRRNDSFVEIVDGLSEGEVVSLVEPAGGEGANRAPATNPSASAL